MNPSPTEIVELFTFVEVTLVQYATVVGVSQDLQLRQLRQSLRRLIRLRSPVKNHQKKKLRRMLLHQEPKARDPTEVLTLLVLPRMNQRQ